LGIVDFATTTLGFDVGSNGSNGITLPLLFYFFPNYPPTPAKAVANWNFLTRVFLKYWYF
jgi:hypothetical protein